LADFNTVYCRLQLGDDSVAWLTFLGHPVHHMADRRFTRRLLTFTPLPPPYRINWGYSADTRTLLVSGDRGFSAAGPHLESGTYLPTDLRQLDLSYSRFRQSPKTLLFGQLNHTAVGIPPFNCALEITSLTLVTYLFAYLFIYLLFSPQNLSCIYDVFFSYAYILSSLAIYPNCYSSACSPSLQLPLLSHVCSRSPVSDRIIIN